MDVMPGYKQTEVGVIPEDWTLWTLADLGTWKGGATPSMQTPMFWANGNIPWASPGDIKSALISDTPMKITEAAIKQSSTTLLPVNSIIIVTRSGILRRFLPIAKNTIPIAINQDIKALIPNDQVVPDFVLHLLASNGRRILATCLKAGTTVESVEFSWLKAFKIALPPTKAEQEAIAEALSDADALIEFLEQLTTKKRHLRQGAMQELLTGKKRLPGFNIDWEVKKIAEIAFPSSEKNTASAQLPVLACSKHFGFVDSLSYFKNQVFSNDTSTYKLIRRGQIGYPANHVEEGSIGLQDLYEVALVSPIYVVFSVSEGVDSYFLHRVLKLDSYCQKFKTATTSSVDRRGSLRWSAFSEITVSIPLLPEQTAIARVLSDMEAEIVALEAKLAKARHIKQGMRHNLLTGKIRLVPQASNVIPFTNARKSKVESAKPHNWQINEAVVIAVLAKHFGNKQYPLSRKRYTKLSYLLHRRVERQAEGYLKKAAGPYNPDTKYKGPEVIAQKNDYMRSHKRDQFTGFIAGEAIGKAQAYFSKWYGSEVLAWLEQFRFKSTDELELLATVDMAMEDLRRAEQTVDVESVKSIIGSHPEWKAKLQRSIFSDANIARVLKICRKLFP